MVVRTNGWGFGGVFTFCSANIVRAHVGPHELWLGLGGSPGSKFPLGRYTEQVLVTLPYRMGLDTSSMLAPDIRNLCCARPLHTGAVVYLRTRLPPSDTFGSFTKGNDGRIQPQELGLMYNSSWLHRTSMYMPFRQYSRCRHTNNSLYVRFKRLSGRLI